MENPFKRLFKRPQADTLPKKPAESNWREEAERQEDDIEELKRVSPEAASLFASLRDPDIPKEEFFRRAKEYGDRAQPIPAEGAYKEIVVGVTPERRLKVKMFANGCVTISASDASMGAL